MRKHVPTQPRLQLPLPQPNQEAKPKHEPKKKQYDPQVEHYVDFYI